MSAFALGSIDALGDEGDSISISVDEGSGASVVATYSVGSGDDTEAVIDGLVASASDGYTIEKVDATNFKLIAPLADGASANSYTTDVTETGNAQATIGNFTGGIG